MEYKILNEQLMKDIKDQFTERSSEWNLEQTKQALNNYEGELIKLQAEVALKTIGIKLYEEDASIANPVFSYENNEEYVNALRDYKIPTMKQELMEAVGKMESTHFQIPLMMDKVAVLKAMEE